MLDSRSRVVTVDDDFQPQDGWGRIEIGIATLADNILSRASDTIRWFERRPLFTFTVWSLWLSCLYFGLGPASYVKVPDCGNGTLPARMVMAQEFWRGDLGNWMGFSGCGVDRVLNNYRLEPLCGLLGILPGWLGYGLIMWAQRFIAGYFFFRVTRDDLHMGTRAALLTGTAYSVFHQIGIHWQWDGFTLYDGLGIPGLPLLFWLANRMHGQTLPRGICGSFVVGVGLALSSPYFQALFFPFLAVFWYTFIQREWTWRRLLLLTFTFIGWALITAPEMLAAAQYVPFSHRSEIVVNSKSPYVQFIENVQHWPNTVWESNKDFLIPAALALVFSRFRDRRPFIVFIAISAILAFVRNYHVFNDNILSHMGILSSFHFHRFIYLVPFLCALCMGLGIDAIPTDSTISLSNRTTALQLHVHPLTVVLLTAFVFYTGVRVNAQRWKQAFRGENYQALYQHPDLLELAKRKGTESEFRTACITDMWRPGMGMAQSHFWTVSPGVMWAYGFETTDGYEVLYSLRYKQFWSEVIHPLMERDIARGRQHVYWGNMLFLWHPTKEPLDKPLQDYYNIDLLSLTNTRYIVSPVPLNHSELKLLPSKHREEFIARKKSSTGQRVVGWLQGDPCFKPLYIYENTQALPRFFLAPHVRLFDDDDALVYNMRNQAASVFRHTVSVNRHDLPEDVELDEATFFTNVAHEAADCGTVTVTSRSSDHWELEVDSRRSCMFFLSQTHSPYWHAEVDGQPAKILPANHTFQGLWLPTAGRHRIVLNYRPKYSPAAILGRN